MSGPTSAELHAEAWARTYELIDLQLAPLGLRAIDMLCPKAGDRVLDVGCGAGQTLLQLAERVGSAGRVIGVDVAPRLLKIADKRVRGYGQIALIEADAQTLDLPPAGLDAVYSRFGVMGFADPAAAFANFHRMLKPGGRLAFCCWRALAENELDRFPLEAAGLQEATDSTPFSFAEPAHIRQTLETAGFVDVAIDPYDAPVSCGDIDATMAVLLSVGALSKIVRENPEQRDAVAPHLRDALTARDDTKAMHLNAAVWIVTATALPT